MVRHTILFDTLLCQPVGLRCRNPHRHFTLLQSDKGPGNTFDLNPKWARNQPLGIFHEIFIEPLPLSTFFFKYQNRYLTPCCGLEVQKPTQALASVKGPCITYDLNPKWARTLTLGIFHGIFIEHPPPFLHKKNPNVKVDM